MTSKFNVYEVLADGSLDYVETVTAEDHADAIEEVRGVHNIEGDLIADEVHETTLGDMLYDQDRG
jgi:hypothetical protein